MFLHCAAPPTKSESTDGFSLPVPRFRPGPPLPLLECVGILLLTWTLGAGLEEPPRHLRFPVDVGLRYEAEWLPGAVAGWFGVLLAGIRLHGPRSVRTFGPWFVLIVTMLTIALSARHLAFLATL